MTKTPSATQPHKLIKETHISRIFNIGFSWTILTSTLVLALAGGCQRQPTIMTQIPAPERVMFDGLGLGGWAVVERYDFDAHGDVLVQDGAIRLNKGTPATGISWTKAYPRTNYEIHLEARRVEGNDFFCGLTFPVGESFCTLILGGWGGGTVGLSNIDGQSAVENETTDFVDFQQNRWYSVRLRVTDQSISAWLDERSLVNVDTAGREFTIWWEQEPLRPLGIASWYTTAELRNIRIKPIRTAQ